MRYEEQLLQQTEEGILKSILTIMQEGVCFLSGNLEILYANPAMVYWYDMDQNSYGKKCYEVFHEKTEPCQNCPVLRSLKTRTPETSEHIYEVKKKRTGWQRIYCMPMFDDKGDTILIIEYVHDISVEKKKNFSMELLHKQIDTLKELIHQKDEEQLRKEQNLVSNLNKSIDTILMYLENMLDEESFSLVKSQLEMTTHGVNKDTILVSRLSGKDLMIARYILQGYSSQEIADLMSVSKKTVDYHRTNIRKKLNLRSEDHLRTVLADYLRQYESET